MIEVKNLTKAFGENIIFKEYNLHVSEGEMVAITGSSGKGKSTLLNIIGSLESYDEGTVEVNKRNLRKINRKSQLEFLRNEVSFVFQNYALMENETVSENIMLGRKQNIKNIENVLLKVGLEGFEKRIVHTLSGGEQQRVALARIILKPSRVILADEPTGNLDDYNAEKVWGILKNLKDMNKTIIVASHETQAYKYFDRIIEL